MRATLAWVCTVLGACALIMSIAGGNWTGQPLTTDERTQAAVLGAAALLAAEILRSLTDRIG